MNSKEALELAILEYEKETIDDENNQWVKNVLKGLKEVKQDLERLEVLISILQKFIDEEEYFVLHDKYLSLGIDGSINITQKQCDVLKECLYEKED